jgi:DNA-binding NarL/FixJ family response regulator
MKKNRILLVDDHQIILDGIRLMLEEEDGMEICAATADPQQALELARSLSPDIIIADISMPGLSGIALTEQIRKEGNPAKIIVLSMYATEDYICSMVKAGANAYLTKQGTTKSELLGAIGAVLRGETYFSPEVQKVVMQAYMSQAAKGSQASIKPASLTNREREILKLYADGYSNQEIADRLYISTKTVDAHKNNIMQKFSFRSTVDMVKFAIRNNLTEL